MHEVQGCFCKTGSLCINRKFVDLEKNMNVPNLAGWPNMRKKRRAHGGGLTHGLLAQSVLGWPAGAGRGLLGWA